MAETRLDALRQQIAAMEVDGVLIPRGDAFSGEEVPAADERLAFVSGFTGSAGMAVVMADQAVLFSDGRYTIQMEAETGPHWDCLTQPQASVSGWLRAHAKGRRLGFDPWLMPLETRDRLARALDGEVALTPLAGNPVDAIWPDRPPPPQSQALPYSISAAGMSREDKINATLNAMAEHHPGVEAMIISDPAGLAWLLNIRGRDLAHTPVILAFAVLTAKGTVTVLAAPERFDGCDGDRLAFAPMDQLGAILAEFTPGQVMVDPMTCPCAIAELINGDPVCAESPITVLKACKTAAEIAAFEESHRLDAVAMIRFLHWFDDTLTARPIREVEVDAKLIEFRAMAPAFISPSFATICGGGGNGAIVHYRAIPGQDQDIPRNSLCLIDSGGQYLNATTDITRTIATGTPPAAMARDFTHVLKAHIALASARFPEGTTGVQLDAITRAPLWQVGMDFAHGTGHGVGCGLGVHEGPASISKRGERPILPGMVISNEPGYYVEGSHGIRIENLIHFEHGGDGMIASTELTLVPIDRRLIITALLSAAEIDWINTYHARIRAEIGPLLDAGEAGLIDWFEAATAPLG